MTDTESMAALVAAVEAGEIEALNATLGRMFAADQELPWSWISDVNSAFRGDLNAAVRLVEALLPGWEWTRFVTKGPVASVWVRMPPKFSMGHVAHEVGRNTARALLLATLRAKVGGA